MAEVELIEDARKWTVPGDFEHLEKLVKRKGLSFKVLRVLAEQLTNSVREAVKMGDTDALEKKSRNIRNALRLLISKEKAAQFEAHS